MSEGRYPGASLIARAAEAVEAMLAVAAREVDETWLANWLRERVTFRT